MFDEDGNPNFAGNDVVAEAVEDYETMVDKGILVEVNDWDQYIGTINNGTVASVINGCWITSTIQAQEDQSGDWGVTTMPRLDNAPNATNYSNNGGAGWMVMNDSPNKDLAIDFLTNTFASSTELYDTILPTTGAVFNPTFRQQKVMHTYRKMNSSVAIRFMRNLPTTVLKYRLSH